MSTLLGKLVNIRRYRWAEFLLLILPSVFIVTGMLQLQLIAANTNGTAPTQITLHSLPTIDTLGPQLLLIVALFAVHVILSWILPDADQTLLPLAGMLSAFGVLMATRLGPSLPTPVPVLGYRQLEWVLVGLVFMLATVWATRSMLWLRLYKYTWALGGLVLVTITLGHALRVKNFDTPTHDQLNLGFGGIAFQPSELLKICLVVFYAAYLHENREMLTQGGTKIGPFYIPPMKHLGPLIILLGISLIMFVALRELGLALLLFGVFVSMLYLASGKLAYVIYSLGAFSGGAYIAYRMFSYVRDRVTIVSTAFNPGVATDKGFQVVQGLIAIGTGGIIGQGFGLGQPRFVPAVQTDFVAAAIGEEFGLVGLFAVVALFMLLIYRGFRIAIRGRDPFEQLLGGGISSVFAIQTFVILAGNLKIIPLTGIPLPFITYGGSSVIANFIMIGLLLRLSAPEDSMA